MTDPTPTRPEQGGSPASMATRLPCQVCGRSLVPLKDGTARRHGRGEDGCQGSGYRLDVWPVGQLLRHYAGSVWKVVATEPFEGLSHQWMTEYRMRCLSDPYTSFAEDSLGREQTFHGEYMHRHGWMPTTAAEEQMAEGVFV